jgi:uncharacterized protein YfaP (DUF2135 family)
MTKSGGHSPPGLLVAFNDPAAFGKPRCHAPAGNSGGTNMRRYAIILNAVLLGLVSALSYAQAVVPIINQPLIPDATVPGGPQFSLTVNGTGFASNSVVNWNGSALATTFVNSSQLTAIVPASDIAKPGSGQVTVVNPGPGVGTSNAIPFEVTRPIPLFTFNRSDHVTFSSCDSVVVADFNGDGNLDIVAALANFTVSVNLGNGHGRFRHLRNFASGIGNDSLVVGDFNGDGKLDLALRGVSVLLGNGDGSFQPPLNYPAGDNSVAVGDFNGDGKLDLASTDSSGKLYILLGNGDGTFQKPVSHAAGSDPYSIAVADFNRDGKLDLAVGLQGEDAVAILLGNGDGSFQAPVKYASAGAAGDVFVADLNADGVLDLVVPNQYLPKVSVLLGNGDGTFQPHVDYPAGANAYRGGVADVNGDGKLDVVITTWAGDNNEYFVLLGNGDGTFQKPRAYPAAAEPLGTAFGDFNNDGILDLVIADWGGEDFSVMLGTVVQLQPDTLDFGTVSVGKNASLSTKLTNIRKSTLEITSITTPGGQGAFSQTNNCGSGVGTGQSCTITVTFTPPKPGLFESPVEVRDKAPGSPQRIFLSGKGSTAALTEKR